MYIVGLAVQVTSSRYERRRIEFNCGVIISESQQKNRIQYERIVRKMALYFAIMEVEESFFFSGQFTTKLPGILVQIFNDLNSKQMVSIRIDDSNNMFLCFPKLQSSKQQITINSWDVPLPLVNLQEIYELKNEADLALLQILPFINGESHVKKIAIMSEVQMDIVIECLQYLVYYNVVKIIDIFKYSNIYVVTKEIQKIYKDQQLQKQCIQYIVNQNTTQEESLDVNQLLEHYGITKSPFQIYCQLSGIEVIEFIKQNMMICQSINIKYVIEFGLLTNILKRLHKHPVLVKEASGLYDLLNFNHKNQKEEFLNMLDGNHCYDQICTKFELSSQDLEKITQLHCNFYYK